MRVKLNLVKKGNRVVGGDATVYRDSGAKLYQDTAFWQAVRHDLLRQGYDVIKKLMWKDGHMVENTQYYVRSRKPVPDGFMLFQTDYAIRPVYQDYNQDGEVIPPTCD